MTNEDLIKRNRSNAQKSTGPRTFAGKNATSKNARRHGATAKPDPASVASWLRVILDKPDLGPEAFFEEDEQTRRALALAEAEARVVAAETALAELEDGRAGDPYFSGLLDDIAGGIKEGRSSDMTKSDFKVVKLIFKMLMSSHRDRTQPGGREHRLRKRYLREARSRRRKSFQLWLDLMHQPPQRAA